MGTDGSTTRAQSRNAGEADASELVEALAALGATPELLTPGQQQQLDEQGFVLFPNVLEPSHVRALADRFDELVAEEGDKAGIEVHQEKGTARLANLVDKSSLFDVCWNHPKVLASVAHVFNWHPFKLNSLNARAALAGEGHQRLHADSPVPAIPGVYQNCNSIWMLDDFTELNGATRVVPGSHRWPSIPADAMSDPTDAHPQQTLLLGQAGSCAVLNAHLWHGGTKNTTGRLRRSIMGGFVPRELIQQTVQREYLRPETLQRLSAPQRYLLEV
ncbi:MAG TPA: phytanoyl-CoA dioxygenase family protein [Acidimicrobiales bacterium]|nr:phytanoyl-CoA dioxygenase family protein [Acidimicrobiales bacterium]